MALDPLKFKIAIDKSSLETDMRKARADLEAGLKDVSVHLKIENLSEIKKKLESLLGAGGGSSSGGSSSSTSSAAKDAEKLLELLEKVRASQEKLKAISPTDSGKFAKEVEDISKKIEEFYSKIKSATDPSAIKSYIEEFKILSKEIDSAAKAQERLKKAEEATSKKYAAEEEKAKTKLAEVNALLKKMESQKTKADTLGVNTTALQNQIDALKSYAKVLDEVASKAKKTTNLSELISGYGGAKTSAKAELESVTKAIREKEKADKDAAREADRAAAAMEREARAAMKLSEEEKELARSIQKSVDSMSHQSQVLSDLKSIAMQYLSVYGIKSFLSNIIEIGGQLEMQRLSIGAILQDTAQATDLFDRIKALALQSPFGVVELDQFTKQLSAYGFQYNELYDMTKRLADISAGAGTDVSRLALALGHVRAEGALTGYTLRQFAMNNIPMVGKLSEKLSELEGHIVTAADVRKRVRNKEIDYGMVEDVIKDLTNEGGMFYNMQEVVSGSVKAKWKNLRDAFDVMYGEMAESIVGGGLKGVATTLTTLAKRWKELGSVALSVAASFGALKLVMLVYNTLLGKQTRAVFAGIAADRQAEISKLRLAKTYRTLTLEEKIQLGMGTKVNSVNLAMAINTGKLTGEQLAHSVALGKVNRELAIMAIMNSKLDPLMKMQMYQTVASVKTYQMFTGTINGLKMAFAGLWGAMKSILLSPMTWIFAAISVITDLWSRNNQEMERASDLSKQLSERSTEGIKNVKAMMSETGISYTKNGQNADFGKDRDGVVSYTPASQMSGDAMIQTMEKWTAFIKDYSSMKNTLLQGAMLDENGKLRELPEQYERLAKAVHQVMLEQVALGQIAQDTEFVLDSTNNGWLWGALNDDLVTNMNDYAKAVKKTDASISKFAMSHNKAISTVLKAAMADKVFADAVNNANIAMQDKEKRNLTEDEQLRMLVSSADLYAVAIRNAEQALGNLGSKKAMSAFSDVQGYKEDELSAQNIMEGDMDLAADAIRQKVKERWHKDIKDLKDYEKQALLQMVTDIAMKSGESTEAIRDNIMKLFTNKIGIPLDINDVEISQRTSLLKEDLEKLVGHDWHIDIRTTTNFSDLITKIRQDYKSAQDYFNNAKPLMIKMGVNVSGGMKVLNEQQQQSIISRWMAANPGANQETIKMAISQWNSLAEAMTDAMDFSKATGISLTDSNPGGKVLKTPKPKKDKSSSGSKEDKEAKAWKERIRLLKDARTWYDKWEKEVGHSTALEKVQEMFKGLVSKKDIESLEAYEKALDAVIAKAQARRAKNKGKDERAEEVIRQGEDEKAQIAMLKFQRDSTAFTSDFDKEMEQLTRRWEIFNSVLDATGDKLLAIKMSGLIGAKNGERNAADTLRNKIVSMPGGNLINFSQILSMSDDEIEREVKNLLGGSEKYSKNIDAIIKSLKEWKKLSNDAIKQDIQTFTKLIGLAVDYQSVIMKIESDYQKTISDLNSLHASGEITNGQYERAADIASTERDRKALDALPAFQSLMDGILTITKESAKNIKLQFADVLQRQLRNGTITAKEYANKLKDINERMSELEKPRDNFYTYMNGGLNGLIQKRFKDGEDMVRDGAQMQQEGQALINQSFGENGSYQNFIDGIKTLNGGKDMVAAGEGMQSAANGMAQTVAIIDMIVHGIDDTIQGLKKAYDNITEMFDALGNESATNPNSKWGKVGTAIGALSAGSSQAASAWDSLKNGNIGGVISGVVGSFTAPITEIAKGHDARRERQIEELKHEVEKIDDTLNLIRKSRDRSLGYDRGSYRKMMAAMYAGNRSDSGKAMYEYYMRGSNGETGYAQELEALKTQREEYLKMYDKENDKKKKSKEALEEYKQKMAELDDQIVNYTQDLANELWSIDLKGWADQIGDALMNAFENGTSAALAYENAVSDIMRSVVSQMLKVGIIEPMMENLRQRLFGENGAFNYNDPSGSMGAVLSELGRFFGKGGEGEQMMTAADEFLTGAEQLLNENYGITMKSSSQPSQTEGIKSQATEETIGILSGQMARIAQDVSVKRIFLTQFVTQQMPTLLERTERQVAMTEVSLQSLRAIEHAVVDGNGAMYDAIYRMSQKIDRAITPDGYMKVQ